MKTSIKRKLLTVSIGLVYLWFGALKFIPNLSPAEDLAKNTIHQLTFGLMDDRLSLVLLAIWEVGLGIMLIFNLFRNSAVILALIHMVCTFAPFAFFPDQTLNQGMLSLTLVGQYIIKNFIIVAALVSIYDGKWVMIGQKNKGEVPTEIPPKYHLIGKHLFKKFGHS